MRTIAAFVQLLQQRHGGRLDRESEEFLGLIVDGVRRMEDLIEALMAYARVDWDAPVAARVELSEVLAQAKANLKAALDDSGAVLEEGALPAVIGEARQLVQLFQNLLSNAVKFRRGHAPRIAVSAVWEDGAWQISFADDGIGIPSRSARPRVRGLPPPAHQGRVPGYGLGARHLQEDRGAARRADRGGLRGGPRHHDHLQSAGSLALQVGVLRVPPDERTDVATAGDHALAFRPGPIERAADDLRRQAASAQGRSNVK